MKRQLEFAPGNFYHIYNRGAGRSTIFREDDNYIFVLRQMKRISREAHLTLIAYCLMPTHYHFLVRQDGEDAARLLPQRVFNSYSKAVNKRYERTGTLFEGPFRAIHVHTTPYLLHLCRYIHANPVKDGLVADLFDWPYSNYPEWLGLRNGVLYDPAFVAEHFRPVNTYAGFVSEYLRERKSPPGLVDYLAELES